MLVGAIASDLLTFVNNIYLAVFSDVVGGKLHTLQTMMIVFGQIPRFPNPTKVCNAFSFINTFHSDFLLLYAAPNVILYHNLPEHGMQARIDLNFFAMVCIPSV